MSSLNAFWGNNVLTELMVPLGRLEHRVLARLFLSPRPVLAGAAALLVFGIAITLMAWLLNAVDNTNGLYVTAVGQQKSVALGDGSQVQLNTNSQIKVDYSTQYRNIRLLQGEVHFDVAKNAERPFRVYAGGGRVQAVGTAFTVYLRNKDINVLVTEGSVALASLDNRAAVTNARHAPAESRIQPGAGQSSLAELDTCNRINALGVLKAGQTITINIADGPAEAETDLADQLEVIADEDLARRQAWRKGLLVFAGEPQIFTGFQSSPVLSPRRPLPTNPTMGTINGIQFAACQASANSDRWFA